MEYLKFYTTFVGGLYDHKLKMKFALAWSVHIFVRKRSSSLSITDKKYKSLKRIYSLLSYCKLYLTRIREIVVIKIILKYFFFIIRITYY